MRNEQQLAPRESGANPQLGVRYSSFAAKTPVALGLLPGKACCCKHVHAPSRTHAFALGHHCALSTCILADAPGSRCISQAGPDCTPLCLQHLISKACGTPVTYQRRLCQGCGANNDVLLAALGEKLPGRTVMLQASGSFFAYEPMRALQTRRPMPLAHFIAASKLKPDAPDPPPSLATRPGAASLFGRLFGGRSSLGMKPSIHPPCTQAFQSDADNQHTSVQSIGMPDRSSSHLMSIMHAQHCHACKSKQGSKSMCQAMVLIQMCYVRPADLSMQT